MRAYGLQYQLFEVMKTERFENKNLESLEFQQICDKATIAVEGKKVSLTFPEGTPITSAQCLKADLVDSDDEILVSIRLRASADDSCEYFYLFKKLASIYKKGLIWLHEIKRKPS